VGTKFAGSIVGEYLPWIGASVGADSVAATVELVPPEEPQPLTTAAIRAGTAASAAVRDGIRLIRSVICASVSSEGSLPYLSTHGR
jgi:hypothetical protein